MRLRTGRSPLQWQKGLRLRVAGRTESICCTSIKVEARKQVGAFAQAPQLSTLAPLWVGSNSQNSWWNPLKSPKNEEVTGSGSHGMLTSSWSCLVAFAQALHELVLFLDQRRRDAEAKMAEVPWELGCMGLTTKKWADPGTQTWSDQNNYLNNNIIKYIFEYNANNICILYIVIT
jgi:hypothetical protein